MRWLATLPLLVLAAACASDGAEDAVRTRLEGEAAKLAGWGNDPVLVTAVREQNRQQLALAEIQRRDRIWPTDTGKVLITAATSGACADRLRALAATDPLYGEMLVMDNKGALVCATSPTSDYYQGDEDKLTRSFNDGEGDTFVDTPRLDESAAEQLAQISLPVRDGESVIGALTVGVRIDAIPPE